MTTDLVKLAARLPAGERNGLDALGAALGDEPSGTYVVVAVVDVTQMLRKLESDETIATLRIRRIEPLTGPDDRKGRELLLHAMERRTGRRGLTLELIDQDEDDSGDPDR